MYCCTADAIYDRFKTEQLIWELCSEELLIVSDDCVAVICGLYTEEFTVQTLPKLRLWIWLFDKRSKASTVL